MLLHIPEVLTQAELTQLRQSLDAADWTDGRETVGAQGAQVKRNEQLPDLSPLRDALGKVVLSALERNPLYFAAALPLRTLPPRFNRYQSGGEYGFHIDGSVMRTSQPGAPHGHVRSDISCTLFLCEPDEYDGGELIVSDTYGEHEVKLPAGEMKNDPFFGPIEVYKAPVVAEITLERSPKAKAFTLYASYQGCNEKLGVCYPPIEKTIDMKFD